MSQNTEISGKDLKQLANKNDTTKAVLRALTERERVRPFSDIVRTRSKLIREGEKIVDSDYMQFWQDLEAAGVGSIIYGRKNKPDRFAWHYSLKDISKAMVEGTGLNLKPARGADGIKDNGHNNGQDNHRPTVENLAEKITFYLSPSRMVEIKIPSNFTKAEAEKVCEAVKTLGE